MLPSLRPKGLVVSLYLLAFAAVFVSCEGMQPVYNDPARAQSLYVVPASAWNNFTNGVTDPSYSEWSSDPFKSGVYLLNDADTFSLHVYNSGAGGNRLELDGQNPAVAENVNDVRDVVLVVVTRDVSRLIAMRVGNVVLTQSHFTNGALYLHDNEQLDSSGRLPGYYALVNLGPVRVKRDLRIDVTVVADSSFAAHFAAFGDVWAKRLAVINTGTSVVFKRKGPDPEPTPTPTPSPTVSPTPTPTPTATPEVTVTVCHIPPGNTGAQHTIEIGASAVAAHLSHGDYLGACVPGDSDGNGNPEPEVTLCHYPPGNQDARHTIIVGQPAVSAHLTHGDTYGPCPTTPPTGGEDQGNDNPAVPGSACSGGHIGRVIHWCHQGAHALDGKSNANYDVATLDAWVATAIVNAPSLAAYVSPVSLGSAVNGVLCGCTQDSALELAQQLLAAQFNLLSNRLNSAPALSTLKKGSPKLPASANASQSIQAAINAADSGLANGTSRGYHRDVLNYINSAHCQNQ